MMVWSDDAAFWVFNQVTNFAYTRYNVIHPEIEAKQKMFEDQFVMHTPMVDERAVALYQKNPHAAAEYLTHYSCSQADMVTYAWKDFYKYLFMKYMDGNIKRPNPGQQNPHLDQPGYGDKWYKKIADETGDKLKMPSGGGH